MPTSTGERIAERISLVLPRKTVDRQYAPAICALALLVADGAAFAAVSVAAVDVRKLIFGSYAESAFSRYGSLSLDLVVLFAGVAICLGVNGRYRGRAPLSAELRVLLSTSLVAALILAVMQFLSNALLQSAPLLAALLLFPVVATIANRSVKRALGRTGMWALPVVVIGVGPSAAEAEASLMSDRSLGYRVIRRIDPAAIMESAAAPRWWPVLDRYAARRLLVALDADGDMQRQVVASLLRERVPFALVPPPAVFPAFSHDMTRFFSHDTVVMSYRDGLSRPVPRFVKAAVDVVLAALLLALVGPLFLLIAMANRRDGGPVLFAHPRVGAGGRMFDCLKFRTMVVDSERVLKEALERDPALAAEWGATRKLRADPRVTSLGRFLRKTSLDELPQLINILRLEMSLVGPRPIVEGEVPLYGEHIAQYYATRPGLTGLWQVSGRSNTSYARRVQLDVWYVNNWTLWNDFVVLLKTIPAVLGRDGAR